MTNNKQQTEIDIAELAMKLYPFSNSERNAFITGYNKAKETYKYTEEDLKKAFTKYAFSSTSNQPYNEEELEEAFNKFIESL
jgi:hypothetical protein